jgi:hypothetical protein
MTSERSQAYGRVMKTLADLSASKFHDHEQDTIRDAADALFFCEDLAADPHAGEALLGLQSLAADMAASGRLLFETAQQLADDVEACGPAAAPVL